MRLVSGTGWGAFRLSAAVLCGVVAASAGAQQTPTGPGAGAGDALLGGLLDEIAATRAAQDGDRIGGPDADGMAGQDFGQEPALGDFRQQQRRGAGGVRTVRPSGAGGLAVGTNGTYEPYLNQPITQETDLPDVGDPIQLSGAGEPVPVIEVLDLVVQATDWNITSTPGIEEARVRFWLNRVKPRDVMQILKFNGIFYDYRADLNFIIVMTRDEFLQSQYGAVTLQEFDLEHASVTEMQTVLTALLSPAGRFFGDPRTGTVLVYDTTDNLAAIEEAIERLDVPLEPVVYELKYVDATALLESLTNMLSERGTAQVDPRVNALIITDLPSRQAQIAQMLKALDQELETRTWFLNYTTPDLVAERIANLVPEEMGSVTVDEDTYQITVTAIPERIAEVADRIAVWDRKPQQVEIEAYLVSASTDITRNLGVDWWYFDERSGSAISLLNGSVVSNPIGNEQGQQLVVGTLPYQVPLQELTLQGGVPTLQDVIGIDPLTGEEFTVLDPEFQGNRIGATLNYLDQEGKVNILSRPRVTVLDGFEAVFENTEEIPFQTAGFTTNNVIGGLSRTIPLRTEFVPIGTVLTVLPRINDEGNIMVEVSAEDSTFEQVTITTAGLDSTLPQKRQNRAETSVMVRSGQTIVIGGLRGTAVEDDVEKVPLLGDLPFLGRLFKSTEEQWRDRELLVFITPTVRDEFTMGEASRLAEFEERNLNAVRDAGKPFWERFQARIMGGDDEIAVAIGETGTLFSDGAVVTITELAEAFASLDAPGLVTVLIRPHGNAPERRVEQVKGLAEEAGLNVEVAAGLLPFVPAPPPAGAADDPPADAGDAIELEVAPAGGPQPGTS